jgi:hypothetical protein
MTAFTLFQFRLKVAGIGRHGPVQVRHKVDTEFLFDVLVDSFHTASGFVFGDHLDGCHYFSFTPPGLAELMVCPTLRVTCGPRDPPLAALERPGHAARQVDALVRRRLVEAAAVAS